jgi:hypothetical protein
MEVREKRGWFSLLFVIPAFLAIAVGTVDAQEQTEEDTQTTVEDETVQTFVLPPSEILGTIERPQAIYLIPKTSMELGEVKLEKQFLKEVGQELFPLSEQDETLGLRDRSLVDSLKK